MNRLQPHEFAKFLRAYRFVGGRLRGAKVLHTGPREVAVEFRVRVRAAITDLGKEPRTVRLTLRLAGVEEFRLQMRPAQPKAKITDARIGYHNGLFYVSLDAVGLEAGETAQVFDFRASEVYAAGRELFWEEAKPKGERGVSDVLANPARKGGGGGASTSAVVVRRVPHPRPCGRGSPRRR